MQSIVLIGCSGHAKVIIDIVEKQNQFKIAGFLDATKSIGESVLGYRVLGKDSDLPSLEKSAGISAGIIAIGDNFIRHNVAKQISEIAPKFAFISAIHPAALIAKDCKVGRGTVIMAGVVVNPSSTIGDFCILNTNASLDHDCVMEDFSSLAPRACTGGNVHIGKFSAISIGATLTHGIKIGDHSVIGAGAVVLEDIPAEVTAFGVPAKTVKKRPRGEPYLT